MRGLAEGGGRREQSRGSLTEARAGAGGSRLEASHALLQI